jgi:ferrous iron transport protein A
MNTGSWIPLSLASTGKSVRFRRVQGGHGLNSRLAAMGLFPGVQVQICHNDRRGPVIIGVNGNRLVLGRGMAEKVAVEDNGK